MELLLAGARLLLALVFAAAGLAKLADRAGSRRALGEFGVPERLAAPLGLLLPPAELAVALALLPTVSSWWGALGALGLLGLFCGGIGWNLGRGRRPDCRCFGQVHSAPIGGRTLGRNGLLAAVAGLVLWQGRPDPARASWIGLGGWR